MGREKEQLNTVHERDLENLLKRLGVDEDFNDDTFRCKFCKGFVNKKNIHSVLPESGTVSFICDKHDCISALLEYLSSKRKK